MAKEVGLEIKISSGNDGVIDCPATRMAEILEKLAHRLRAGQGGGKIHDVNGNQIGYMDFFVQ